MAISTGTTVVRELSATTQGGLSELLARAFSSEQPFGYDKDGLKLLNDLGGNHQQSTVAFRWNETRQETLQKAILNLTTADSDLLFTGHQPQYKIQRVVISGATANFGRGNKSIRFTIGGLTLSVTYDGTQAKQFTLAGTTTDVINRIKSGASSIVDSVTAVNSTTFDITYKLSAGDATFGSTVDYIFIGSVDSSSTATRTTRQEFLALSPAATFTASVYSIESPVGTTKPVFNTTSLSTEVAAGGSLLWYNLANNTTGLLDGATGISGHGNSSSGYVINLESGYAISSLILNLAVVRDGTTTTSRVTLDLTGTDTVSYVSSQTETFGRFNMAIEDPIDNSVHTFQVNIPENTPIAKVESIIKDSINNVVIGKDALGVDILGSSIIKATAGTTTNAASISSFTVTLDWASAGTFSGSPVSITSTGLTSAPGTFDTITEVVAGTETSSTSPIAWDHVTTSSTLQPGGETTHYATMLFTKT